jgi:hypothetical protein
MRWWVHDMFFMYDYFFLFISVFFYVDMDSIKGGVCQLLYYLPPCLYVCRERTAMFSVFVFWLVRETAMFLLEQGRGGKRSARFSRLVIYVLVAMELLGFTGVYMVTIPYSFLFVYLVRNNRVWVRECVHFLTSMLSEILLAMTR